MRRVASILSLSYACSASEADRPFGDADADGDTGGDGETATDTGTDTDTDSGGEAEPPVVDASTLTGKLVMGYQGWHFADPDGSGVGWWHWTYRQVLPENIPNDPPNPENVAVDLWPDVSELDPDELYDTDFTSRVDQSPMPVYSSFNAKTVVRHFGWMADYGLDGVMVQRFVREIDQDDAGDVLLGARDRVIESARQGAEEHGRVFAVMYDIAGSNNATLVNDILEDWVHLVDDLGVTGSDRYLHHEGRPLLAIWGFAFGGPDTPDQLDQLLAFLKDNPEERYNVSLMLGIPYWWRDPDWYSQWHAGFLSADVLSPWTVSISRSMDRDDMDYLAANAPEVDYLPVIYPGFSWHNLSAGWLGEGEPLNWIPREGGEFYWEHVYKDIRGGATMLYGAMFDEVDEGTAMYKLVATQEGLPAEGSFVALDQDGYDLPSDWYLRLAGEASRVLRGDVELTREIPIEP